MTVRRPDISIVIVSYNTAEMTLACIDSVLRFAPPAVVEIIVVDNASSDGSPAAIAARFPNVRQIAAATNLGFAAANNLAVKQATGEYVLLLNPDTLILDGAIPRLLEFARANPAARIWGGRTLFAGGSLNPASCWKFMTLWSLALAASGLSAVFRGSRLFDPESYGGWQRDTVRQVDIVVGCFLLIDRKLWDGLQGFDERFFMYAEEADLCYRARAHGARPMVTPDAAIIHYGGASEPVRAAKIKRLFRGKVTFLRKHWPPPKAFLGVALLKLHSLVRYFGYSAAAVLLRRSHHATAAAQWRGVWADRGNWSKDYPA